MITLKSNKGIIAGGIMLVSTLLVFLLIGFLYNRYVKKEERTSIPVLKTEIEELEASLVDVVQQSKDRDLDLKMRDQLLLEKNMELAAMSKQLSDLKSQHADSSIYARMHDQLLLEAKRLLKEASESLNKEREILGLIYRVQIGTLEYDEAPDFNIDDKMFLIEEVEDHSKYVLGNFRSYEDCQEFRDLLRLLGFTDAWIVTYYDGERIHISEAASYMAGN